MRKYLNDFDEVIHEYFDINDTETREQLLSLTEANEQNGVMLQLTSKLYSHITRRITNVNYGTIPDSKGDITKIENYNQLVECIEVIREILSQNKESTEPIDIIQKAFDNIEKRTDDFETAFKFSNELPILIYCNIVLAIISSVSLMISSSIEYIKDPTNEGFKVALDRTGLRKTKDNLLFNSLSKFNKACDKGTIDKVINELGRNRAKNLLGEILAGGIVINTIALTGIALTIIPLMRELVYFFYHSRVQMSEYFEIQAELLQMNIYELDMKDEIEPDERNKIKQRQEKIVQVFKKISNTIALSTTKSVNQTEKEIMNDNEVKYTVNDLQGSGSALF